MHTVASSGALARARQVFSRFWTRAGQAPPPVPEERDRVAAFDLAAAWREGWTVSEGGVNEDGSACVQLQRLDSMPDGGRPVFASDGDAWRHVVARARASSRLHAAALALVDRHERRIIEAHCGGWMPSPD